MRRVTWSAAAIADLRSIRAFLSQYGNDVAAAEIRRLVLAARWLVDWPEAGPAFRVTGWRKWKPRLSRHLLSYRPVEGGIETSRVHHEREDWLDA